ncbi:uncharacterized protein LOC126660976 [Mercurialis annua]|uniref:uncharacterized protein LOC126660976 n=1 Tax=Mercurialis annua TaxID=3986 RepID=UPI00215DDBF4|nr:uncharacterized protein LOC126660976 [Mercurialis annua]
MADPITAAVVGSVVAGVFTLTAAAVAGSVATAGLGYQIWKDRHSKSTRKRECRKNLEKNYKLLDMNLQKLAGLAIDMEKAVVMKAGSKDTSSFKIWKTRAEEIRVEAKGLFAEYEGVSKCRKKKIKYFFSLKMEEKCAEITKLVEEAQFMILHF